jgi:hypothetical protein
LRRAKRHRNTSNNSQDNAAKEKGFPVLLLFPQKQPESSEAKANSNYCNAPNVDKGLNAAERQA